MTTIKPFTVKISSFGNRFLIALCSIAFYSLSFQTLYPFVGDASAAFNVLPAAVFGWFFKIRGGFLYGLISFPLNLVLFYSQGNSLSSHLLPTFAASSAFALTGMGVGWIKNLNTKIKIQSIKLQREILRRTRAEERLTHEALHDPLTNLPNRRLLYNRIEHALAWNKRNPGNMSTLLYLDLNKFKSINDTLGHKAGDRLLIEVANRMKSTIRDVDTVGRMGGDEFAILLEASSSPENVITIIERIQKSFTRPFKWDEHSVTIGASIGAVINITSYAKIEDIIRDADIAMYCAKSSGGNQFKIFENGMQTP